MTALYNNIFSNCTSLKNIEFPSLTVFSSNKINEINEAYKKVWLVLQNDWSKEELSEYKNLLKINNYNYQQTILTIELNKLKK